MWPARRSGKSFSNPHLSRLSEFSRAAQRCCAQRRTTRLARAWIGVHVAPAFAGRRDPAFACVADDRGSVFKWAPVDLGRGSLSQRDLVSCSVVCAPRFSRSRAPSRSACLTGQSWTLELTIRCRVQCRWRRLKHTRGWAWPRRCVYGRHMPRRRAIGRLQNTQHLCFSFQMHGWGCVGWKQISRDARYAGAGGEAEGVGAELTYEWAVC